MRSNNRITSEYSEETKHYTGRIKESIQNKGNFPHHYWCELRHITDQFLAKNSLIGDSRYLSHNAIMFNEKLSESEIINAHERQSTAHYCKSVNLLNFDQGAIHCAHHGFTKKRNESIDCTCTANILGSSTIRLTPLCCINKSLTAGDSILQKGSFVRIVIPGDTSENIIHLGKDKSYNSDNGIFTFQEINKFQLISLFPDLLGKENDVISIAESIMKNCGYQSSDNTITFYPCKNFLSILELPLSERIKYLTIH